MDVPEGREEETQGGNKGEETGDGKVETGAGRDFGKWGQVAGQRCDGRGDGGRGRGEKEIPVF